MVNYKIIVAGPEWAEPYRLFSQKAYSSYYARPELGITAENFSDEVFATSRVKDYFAEHFIEKDDRRVWIALDSADEILGGIIAYKNTDHAEIKGFYVAPDKQGQGIGKALYAQALEYIGDQEIRLDVVNYMDDTIAMYERWGFSIDKSKGYVEYPWEGWTNEQRYANRGIFMIKPSSEVGKR